ncbi:hypothetical protein JCM10295v2_003488 [Rhodotorula toruloides]
MHGRAQRADVFHEETKSTAYRSKVDANILPPAYRSAIATEWAHGLSGSCAELEDIYWLFDGWDELADQLYLEWAAHVSEVDAVRRAFNEFNPEKKVFVSLGALRNCATDSKDVFLLRIPFRNGGEAVIARTGLCLLSDDDILPHIQSWTEISGYRTSLHCIDGRSWLSQ